MTVVVCTVINIHETLWIFVVVETNSLIFVKINNSLFSILLLPSVKVRYKGEIYIYNYKLRVFIQFQEF